ncbi:MAG: heat-inducible transcription repressor HrcA [Armatimonadetes bacterium]|nr:heat-inducible transcription repressor HrcA [Armatimonadota bacterium]
MTKKGDQRQAEELDPRKQTILKAVVDDYVETAEPVGSESLLQRYPLGVKPATVRNEMATISDMGYLHQPHTSAGRAPTHRGYRYYVDRLAEPMNEDEARQIARRLAKTVESQPEMVTATLRMLSGITRYAAVATTARDQSLKLLKCVVTPLTRGRALMMCAFDNGSVDSHVVDLGSALSAQQMRRLNASIAKLVEGQQAAEVVALKLSLPVVEDRFLQDAIARTLRAAQSSARVATRGELYYEGILKMMEHVEFQRSLESLEQVLGALQDKHRVYDAMEQTPENELSVMVGEENPVPELQNCSMVVARYKAGKREGGVIGVVGPARMRYSETLPLVQQMARSLSGVLAKLIEE